MAKFNDVANALVEKKEITVFTGEKKAHDNLRTRLCKYFSSHKKLLESIGAGEEGSSVLSVSAEYNPATQTSTFFIRAAKKFVSAAKEYEILNVGADDGTDTSAA